MTRSVSLVLYSHLVPHFLSEHQIETVGLRARGMALVKSTNTRTAVQIPELTCVVGVSLWHASIPGKREGDRRLLGFGGYQAAPKL